MLNLKDELISWCITKKVLWIEDPSNEDCKYARNQIRHKILPEALKINPGLAKVIKKKIIKEMFSLADMFLYLRAKKIDAHEKWYEFWYRITGPWACVVITLFAIPAGISTGRQSVIKGVILALVAFFSFYALTLVLMFLGQHGWCPPALAALLPNLVYLCIGSAMYRKLT